MKLLDLRLGTGGLVMIGASNAIPGVLRIGLLPEMPRLIIC
jgi:hypothetical protein